MPTLKDVEKLANDLLGKDFKIKSMGYVKTVNLKDIGYRFDFDNARRRAGCCFYTRKKITLSKFVCKNNIDRMDSIEDTMRHEIAHAISYHLYGRRGKGHGDLWKDTAKQVGAKPERCYTKEKYGNEGKTKYTLKCPSCGVETGMHRKPKLSRSCSKCSGGSYNEKFKMEVTKNY